ncbi:MAG: hypothetical protein KC910_25130 [Candidatus Eremiobacteraeota bacterium]|nr:hypothetical protein [Candidatus Eremiobacteraeota bacterium]
MKVGSRLLKALDDYSSPRPNTKADFEEASYIQSALLSVEDGFCFMGVAGVAVALPPALVSTYVNRKTNSRTLGVLSGAATGTAIALAVGAMTGGAGLALGVGGALVGALEGIRGDKASEVRDAALGGLMATGAWMPGPSKIAAGIGAAVGGTRRSKWVQALVGGATGVALGGAIGMMGLGGGPLMAAILGGVGGAVGPVVGQRFNQLTRNLASDMAGAVHRLAGRLRASEKTALVVGTFPAQAVHEFAEIAINSDGNLAAIGLGLGLETAAMVHSLLCYKEG